MNDDQSLVEQSFTVQDPDGGVPVPQANLVDLVARFGDVEVARRIEGASDVQRRGDRLRGNRMQRMRGGVNGDDWIAVVCGCKRAAAFGRFDLGLTVSTGSGGGGVRGVERTRQHESDPN